jgi:hypothetical protein
MRAAIQLRLTRRLSITASATVGVICTASRTTGTIDTGALERLGCEPLPQPGACFLTARALPGMATLASVHNAGARLWLRSVTVVTSAFTSRAL